MAKHDNPEVSKKRDELKGKLVNAVLKDFSANGETVLATYRNDSPSRYFELVERCANLLVDDNEQPAATSDADNAGRLSAHSAKISDISAVFRQQ